MSVHLSHVLMVVSALMESTDIPASVLRDGLESTAKKVMRITQRLFLLTILNCFFNRSNLKKDDKYVGLYKRV